MAERLSQSLQENVITLLCYDDEAARVIVSLVDPALFEGDYREVAQRFMKFFRDYKEAPKSHAADQFPEITDKHDRSGAIYKRILRQMLSLKQDINRQFVPDRATSHSYPACGLPTTAACSTSFGSRKPNS
jgi:hypothetical protein